MSGVSLLWARCRSCGWAAELPLTDGTAEERRKKVDFLIGLLDEHANALGHPPATLREYA